MASARQGLVSEITGIRYESRVPVVFCLRLKAIALSVIFDCGEAIIEFGS